MKKRARAQSEHRVWQLLLIFLLIALLVLMLAVEVKRNRDTVWREKAQISQYTYTDALAGYVFREEVPLNDSGNKGALKYAVADGDAVESKENIAVAYSMVNGQSDRPDAAAIYDEIARLERSLQEAAQQAAYTASYAGMMEALSEQDWRAGARAAKQLGEALSQSSVSTVEGSEAAVQDRIAELRARADQMVKWASYTSVTAPIDGRFTVETDGYEHTFSLTNVANASPQSLALWLENNEPGPNDIGKVVSQGLFYLVVPVTGEQAMSYSAGVAYHVQMLRGGEANMQLERISFSEDEANALLILRADRMPVGMDLSRRQPILIERQTVSGIRVPLSALQTVGEETFVYVAKNGVAKQRRVNVLCRENGCCIVAEEHEENSLRVGEQILLTARSLYEGKVLKN